MVREMILKNCEIVICEIDMGIEKPKMVIPQVRFNRRFFSLHDFDLVDEDFKEWEEINNLLELNTTEPMNYLTWKNKEDLERHQLAKIKEFSSFENFRKLTIW